MKKNKARVLALYLPQFYPTPQNDRWWGKGFTEWTNVGKARKLYRGHYQPRVPSELGYYDLRLPEVREQQAALAKEYGVEGFCYWHYWFGNGHRILETPFNEVLRSGKPDFPFCLAWANHSWKKKTWDKDASKDEVLIEQVYPGVEDYTAHFYEVLPAFRDPRYVRIDGKPFFMIFAPLQFDDVKTFIQTWRRLVKENGLDDIYFVGQADITDKDKILELGFDAVNNSSQLAIHSRQSKLTRAYRQLVMRLLNRPRIYRYSKAMKYFSDDSDKEPNVIPSICPNWDHSPRLGKKGIIFHGSTPRLFQKHVEEVVDKIRHKPEENRIIILKSWNEWAEGNYVEPDLKFGRGYLEALKKAIEND